MSNGKSQGSAVRKATLDAGAAPPLRFVSAASLFDGHDAAINVKRRLLQRSGAEVIHLGHNRSAAAIVACAIAEDADGIAVTSIDRLLADPKPFAELEAAVASLLDSRREELDEIKLRAGDASAIGEKTFNVELLGSEVLFDPESVFARFALQETFLDIANAYFGMLTKLRYYNVWQTFATKGAARESQHAIIMMVGFCWPWPSLR